MLSTKRSDGALDPLRSLVPGGAEELQLGKDGSGLLCRATISLLPASPGSPGARVRGSHVCPHLRPWGGEAPRESEAAANQNAELWFPALLLYFLFFLKHYLYVLHLLVSVLFCFI